MVVQDLEIISRTWDQGLVLPVVASEVELFFFDCPQYGFFNYFQKINMFLKCAG